MNKKLIALELVAALVMSIGAAIFLGFIVIYIGGIFMGIFMPNFTFFGERGYETTGTMGIILGLPLGGMIGAYVMRLIFGKVEQKLFATLGIGLLVGIILLTILLINISRGTQDQLRFSAGTKVIESTFPEMEPETFGLNCFAGCSYRYDKDGSDYYYAYIVQGSGVPIAKATCFKFDKDSVVTKVGEFPKPGESNDGSPDINPKNCSGIKKTWKDFYGR
jgi:hypothetical protein